MEPTLLSRIAILAHQVRRAVAAIEAERSAFAEAEAAHFRAPDDLLAKAKYETFKERQDALFAEYLRARASLYAARPATEADALLVLRVVREIEEGVFEDSGLADAFDAALAALGSPPSPR